MKQIIALLLMLYSFSTADAQQAGRTRISFIGFNCLRESWDDAMQLDGKCDEVFLNFNVTIAKKDGSTVFNYEKMTPVYGDNNGSFGNRTNAGSCTDLFGNLKGGIKTGDTYRCNEIIGEYNLDAGDVVSLIPTMWEWDPEQSLVSKILSGIKSHTNAMNQRIVGLVNSVTPTVGNYRNFILEGNQLNLPSSEDLLQSILGKQGTRPIGMATNGAFVPKVIAFTPGFIQMALTSNFGYGTGIIPVSYNEEMIGNSRDHGNYVLLFKAEWIPATSTTVTNTTQPVAVSGSTSTVLVQKRVTNSTLATNNTTTLPSSLPGNWQGTLTETNGPSKALRIQLNADKTMLVQSSNARAKGNLAGTFSFDNNTFKGTYTDENGTVTTLTGNFNGSNLLTGSFTRGSKGGTWSLSKF